MQTAAANHEINRSLRTTDPTLLSRLESYRASRFFDWLLVRSIEDPKRLENVSVAQIVASFDEHRQSIFAAIRAI